MHIKLAKDDIIVICGISNPSDFAWGLRIDAAGIWANAPDRPELLTAEELLAIRPPHGFHEPVLALPCSPEHFRAFLQYAEMECYLEELDDYLVSLAVSVDSFDALKVGKVDEVAGCEASQAGAPTPRPRSDALKKILLEVVDGYRLELGRNPTSKDVMSALKRLSRGGNHPVIQEVRGHVIYWRRDNGKEDKTTLSGLRKRLVSINQV